MSLLSKSDTKYTSNCMQQQQGISSIAKPRQTHPGLIMMQSNLEDKHTEGRVTIMMLKQLQKTKYETTCLQLGVKTIF